MMPFQSTCQLADWKKHKPTCTAKAAELSGSGGNFRPSTSGGDTALRRASLPQQPDEQGSSVPLTSQGASAGAKAKASAASAVSAAAAKNINDDDEDDKDKTAMLKGMGFVAVAAAAVIGGILWLRRK